MINTVIDHFTALAYQIEWIATNIKAPLDWTIIMAIYSIYSIWRWIKNHKYKFIKNDGK